MRINGKTKSFTELDEGTQSILLKRLHPRINNYNDVVLFLMQCNMDIKYIGSGEAAKALIYYVTDYITKESLATHIGLGALAYAIQQNEIKYHSDNDTPKSIKGKSLFIKTVNAMMARQELSHQQVLSYLIGRGDVYKANLFRLLKWVELDRFVQNELREEHRNHTEEDNSHEQLDEDVVMPNKLYNNHHSKTTVKDNEHNSNTDDDSHTCNSFDINYHPKTGIDGPEGTIEGKDEITLHIENEDIVPTNVIFNYCH